MRTIALKIIASLIVIAIAIFLVQYFYRQSQASEDGSFHLIIMDENETIVFEGDIEFYQGEIFYETLERNFDLITQPPTFMGIVILGIENDQFSVLTNFTDQFLAIEVFDGTEYRKTAEGAVLIEPVDGDMFRIRVENVEEGPSS